ncbi:RES family NAD+ phosphorylase [Persicobacter sp. CCB-QB2]|uniref:RES family NAD+ phosphorylase n=1 Tax=Persicobacter sp. CCB-QB2 TaxID=1561025 RepID=UPI0006A9A5A4|nr:RES family NAD+ phosphorylase [Persicobacter sp. CCB-QB2]
MQLFRLSRFPYKDELSGKGAAKFGNRWNSKGTEVIYTASSRALANAEVAVHLPLGILPQDYYMVEIGVPENSSTLELNMEDLPKGWNALPHIPATQKIGDLFVRENAFLLLKVPSVVVFGDFNYVINPFHAQLSEVKIVNTYPFPFDRRLLRI